MHKLCSFNFILINIVFDIMIIRIIVILFCIVKEELMSMGLMMGLKEKMMMKACDKENYWFIWEISMN